MRLRFGAWVRLEPLDNPEEVRLTFDPGMIIVERARPPKERGRMLRNIRRESSEDD